MTYEAGVLGADPFRVLLSVTVSDTGVARKAIVSGDDTERMGQRRYRRLLEAPLKPRGTRL